MVQKRFDMKAFKARMEKQREEMRAKMTPAEREKYDRFMAKAREKASKKA